MSWPYKFITSSSGKFELYDVSNDPGEDRNLAEGGTAAGIDRVHCEASIDAQHVKDLAAFYKALGQH